MSSTSTHQSRGIDLERLILMPLFVLLLILNGAAMWSLRGDSLDRTGWLGAAHGTVITGFYALLVGLLLFRAPSKATTRSSGAVVAAYVGTFAPFLLVLQSRVGASERLLLLSTTVMLFGLGITLYGLVWLGRSFGVVPAGRNLVTSGPYRWVRHPLYAGEFVTFFGAVLVGLSPFTVTLLVAWISVQVYRALQEEKLLTQVFPEYGAYMAKTARFVPGLL